jgi:hypothetical protein
MADNGIISIPWTRLEKAPENPAIGALWAGECEGKKLAISIDPGAKNMLFIIDGVAHAVSVSTTMAKLLQSLEGGLVVQTINPAEQSALVPMPPAPR